MKLVTLKRRAEFQRIRGGGRWSGPAFVLEGRERPAEATAGAAAAGRAAGEGPRFGFTVTRKLGKAVDRNRMRRRLREAVRAKMQKHAKAGFDYVLIAREAAMTRSFGDLGADLEQAFRRVHQGPRGARRN